MANDLSIVCVLLCSFGMHLLPLIGNIIGSIRTILSPWERHLIPTLRRYMGHISKSNSFRGTESTPSKQSQIESIKSECTHKDYQATRESTASNQSYYMITDSNLFLWQMKIYLLIMTDSFQYATFIIMGPIPIRTTSKYKGSTFWYS